MKLLLTQTCQGVIDTDRERQRINKAFRNNPEIRLRLTLLLEAIEDGEWDKASEMLEDEWWQGSDEARECPRAEFIGMLHMTHPRCKEYPAIGFDLNVSYGDLVHLMTTQLAGPYCNVQPLSETGKGN